jgi:hypothetical protein
MPVEGPTRCPVYRLLDCHCSARHCWHPPVRSQPKPQVFTQFRRRSSASAPAWPAPVERENRCLPAQPTSTCATIDAPQHNRRNQRLRAGASALAERLSPGTAMRWRHPTSRSLQ